MARRDSRLDTVASAHDPLPDEHGRPFVRFRLRSLRRLIVPAVVAQVMVCPVMAQVQTDGSVGPAATLSGSMVISNALGKQIGPNLFHSFSLFNVNTGESVLFTSSSPGQTTNVIGRVTGSSASWIDGSLTSNIPGAALWLINPNGIAFGQHAEVSVPGSFHASTADYLAFEDGTRYTARGTPALDALLSVAKPSAFGFLSTKPAPITVAGSLIYAGGGNGLSLVGGDIDITGGSGFIMAPGGRIDLVSVASAGEARLNKAGAMDVSSFSRLGSISLGNSADLDVSTTTGSAGGSVFIRGGRFVMTGGSSIWSDTGSADGGPIDIGVTGDISLSDKSSISTYTSPSESGRAGDIRINAGGDFAMSSNSTIYSLTTDSYGDSGQVSVSARNVRIADGAKISTQNLSPFAYGGDVSVKASDSIVIAGGPGDFSTGIESYSLSSYGDAGTIWLESKTFTMNGGAINTHNFLSEGAAGDISMKAGTVALSGGAIISSSSRGYGPGGTLFIQASERASLAGESYVQSTSLLTGAGGLILISTPDLALDHSYVETSTIGFGKAGDIALAVKGLTLNSGAISSESRFAGGAAGNIAIIADTGVTLTNTGTSWLDRPRIVTGTSGSGNAGSITIVSPRVVIDDGYVDSSTLLSMGNAGAITLNVNDLVLSNGGQVSTYTGFGTTGRGGTIDINARGSVSCFGTSPTIPGFASAISAESYGFGNAGHLSIDTGALSLTDSTIRTTSEFASGGNIGIKVDTSLYLLGSQISASANGVTPADNGGNLTIGSPQFMILNRGDLLANANAGNGGNITLAADYVLKSAESRIDASSRQGLDGQILIDSPNEVMGTVAVLEVPSLDISEILRERCAARALRERSSFTIEGKGGMSPRPGGFLFSPSPEEPGRTKTPATGRKAPPPRPAPSCSAGNTESTEVKK
jgi:filamentous hemagglutinin family protein